MNKEDRKWLDEKIGLASLGVVIGGALSVVIMILVMIFDIWP
jgi:hypothetical protein